MILAFGDSQVVLRDSEEVFSTTWIYRDQIGTKGVLESKEHQLHSPLEGGGGVQIS